MSRAAKLLGTSGTPANANTVVGPPEDEDDDDKPKKALGSGVIIMEGMLQKKSPKGLFKAWQDRYFKLYSGAIEYYKKPTDAAPAGNINILAVKFVLAKADRNATRFDLVTGEGTSARTYSMLAKDTKDRDKWVAAITEAVKKAFSPPSKDDKDREDGKRGSSSAAAAAASPKSTTPATPTSANSAAGATPKSPKSVLDDDSDLPAHLKKSPPQNAPAPVAAPGSNSGKKPETPTSAGSGSSAAAAAQTPHKRAPSGAEFAFGQVDTKQNATYDAKRKPRNAVANPVEPSDFQLQVYHTERWISTPGAGYSTTGAGALPNSGWGTLYHARHKLKPNHHFLIHAIAKDSKVKTDGSAEKVLGAMSRVKSHPYLLQYVHGGETEDTVFGVYQPPVDRYTSLTAYLRVHKRFPESVVRLIGAQVLIALNQLHENGLTARNLSTDTLHLDGDGNVVFADLFYGCNETKLVPKECLAPEYQPPETINASKPSDDTRVSDYWRWGILLYELITGVAPWSVPKRSVADDAKAAAAASLNSGDNKVAVDGNGVPINAGQSVSADAKAAKEKEFENWAFVLPYAEELDAKDHFVRCAQISALIESRDFGELKVAGADDAAAASGPNAAAPDSKSSAPGTLPASATNGVELSSSLIGLLKLVLVRDPKQRLKECATPAQEFELLRSHPWFNEYSPSYHHHHNHQHPHTAYPNWSTLANANGGYKFAGPGADWIARCIFGNHQCVKTHRNPKPESAGAAAAVTGSGGSSASSSNEMVRLDVDVITARGIHGWYRPASSKPDKNDGVTVHPPSTHVRVTLDSEVNTTVTVAESDKPKYNGRFSFQVNSALQSWSELLFEVLEDEKKSTMPLVGAISIPMHTILSLKNSTGDGEWYPIIDARTGFTFGELKIKWSVSAPTSGKSSSNEMSRTTRTGKRFAEYFGFTDFSDPLEFPMLADYDPTGGKARRPAKGGAGGPKRPIRYQTGNFDLDLSYILPNKSLVAMALPGSSIAHGFTSIGDFLKKFHASHGTRIYNLCSESKYAPEKIGASYGDGAHGNGHTIVEYPFEELSTPPFALLLTICQDIERYLSGSSASAALNYHSIPTGGPSPASGGSMVATVSGGGGAGGIAASGATGAGGTTAALASVLSLSSNTTPATCRTAIIHCRTGRGRSGTVLCAYLMYSKVVDTADDALMWFATKRTQNVRGVSYPSQIRYLRYFERYLKEYLWVGRPFSAHGTSGSGGYLSLQHVRFHGVPQFNQTGGCDPYFVILGPYPYKQVIYDHYKATGGKITGFHEKTLTHCEIPCGERKVHVWGDIRFVFYNDASAAGVPERMMSFTLHTNFISNYYVSLTKHEIDGANRDKDGRKFDPNFKIELFFKHERR